MEIIFFATSHSSVWGVCSVSAGVVCKCAWSVRKYICIYKCRYIKFKYLYTWISVAVRLVTCMRYIPSQTLDVVRPMRGEGSGVDFPSQAEDRLYTLIPIYHNGTMQSHTSCHSHFSNLLWYWTPEVLSTLPLYKTPPPSLHYHC